MSIADRQRLREIAVKGVHLGLRQVALAPEQVAARRLAEQIAALPAPTGPRVLMVTPRDWAAHVQWDAMLGHALRLRNAEVQYLRCGGGLGICDRANTWEAPPMPCRTCNKYTEDSLDAHGHDSITMASSWQAGDQEWPELDELTLEQLEDIEADGLALGSLMRIPIRWFLMRSTIDQDPLAPATARAFLRSARLMARAIRTTLDQFEPDCVVVLNGLFSFEAVTIAICRERGIPYVSYERGLIKETLVYERNDIACLFNLDSAWRRLRDVPLTPEQASRLDDYLAARRVGARTIDRFWGDAVFEPTARTGSDRLAVMFPNLTWDSAAIDRGRAFDDIRSWIEFTVEHFASRPDHQLLIRAHPAETKLPGKQSREPVAEILDAVGCPPNVRLIGSDEPQSSYPLMEAADVGLVFASTAGLEMAAMGKPVIVAGATHYADKGFTLEADSPADLARLIDEVLDDPAAVAIDADLARRYAHLFFFEHPVQVPGAEEHVLGLARITVHDVAELAPGASSDLDRICDLVLGA